MSEHEHKFGLREISLLHHPFHAGACDCGVVQHIEPFVAELESRAEAAETEAARLKAGIKLALKYLRNTHVYRNEAGELWLQEVLDRCPPEPNP